MQIAELQAVRSAANPILLREAIAAFGLRTPELNAFLKKGADYCAAFKARFPEVTILSHEKVGTVKAAWDATIGLLTDFNDAFEPPKFLPLNDEELFSSLANQGREDLAKITDNLNHLEDLLSNPNFQILNAFSQEIRALREERMVLELCPPQENQGVEAVQTWAESVLKHAKTTDLLIEACHQKMTETIAQKGEAVSKTLRAMIAAPLREPMPKEALASLLEKEIGQNTKIEPLTLEAFTSLIGPIALASNDPLLVQAAQDISVFESFLQPFKEAMRTYPLKRFIKEGVEYSELLEPAAKRFEAELKSRLDDLDSGKRSSLFIPLTSARPQFMDISQSTEGKSFLDRYSLLRIEKSKRGYEVKLYQNAPQGDAALHPPYLQFEGIKRKQLLDTPFIKEILKYTAGALPTEKLKALRTIFSENWGKSEKFCKDQTPVLCHFHRAFWTLGSTIDKRFDDFTPSFTALLGDSTTDVEYSKVLADHFNLSPLFPSSEETLPYEKKAEDSPWGIWEALLLGEKKSGLLFDLKLSSLVQASQTKKEDDLENELLLALAKIGHVSLSREVNENPAIEPAKIPYIQSVLDEVKARLAAKEKELQLSLAAKVEPVSVAPVFGSINAPIKMPPIAPTQSDAPISLGKMEWFCDVADWTPSASDLRPLHDFAIRGENSYKEGNYDGIILSTQAFFDRFNFVHLDEAFWNELTPKAAEATLLSLEKIAESYFKSYFDANVPRQPDAKSGLLMMEILFLTDKLLSKLPSEHRLKEERMPLAEFYPYLFNRRIFFRLGDPKLDERLAALRSYSENSLIHLSHYTKDTTIFGMNMAPLKRQFLGFLAGDLVSAPRYEILGRPGYFDERKRWVEEHFVIRGNDRLQSYTKEFFDAYDKKHPDSKDLLQAEKVKNMLAKEVADVLPSTFYAAQKVAFIARYFTQGTFVKPTGFLKTENAYDISYESIPSLDTINPLLRMGIEALSGMKEWFIFPKVEGIDASVFLENPDLPDGLSRAHQFNEERPTVDPVIASLRNPLLQIQGDPLTDAFFQSWDPFRSFAPGITPEGRNYADLNVVMIQPVEKLKQYLTKQEYEQIASLRTEPGVQIANTLSFFRKNSLLLKIPDMQSYFNQLIFDPPLLSLELKDPNRGPELERQLAEFAGEEYSLNMRLGNMDYADYCIGLISRLRQYCLYARKENPDIYRATPLPEIFKAFPKILEDATLKASDSSKGMLHGLSAQDWMSKDSFENGTEFLRHAILYHRFPPSGKTVDPLLALDIRRLLARFTPDILKLKKERSFFDRLVQEAYPNLPKDVKWIASDQNPLVFFVEDHPVSLDLQQGLVMAPGIDGIPMPADGLNSPVYTALYGTDEFHCKAISTSTFEFKDKEGRLNRLVRQADGIFAIHRRFPERRQKGWYQYIPQSAFASFQEEKKGKSALEEEAKKVLSNIFNPNEKDESLPILPAIPLIEGHSHWYTDTIPGELLIADSKGRIQYRAEITGSEILKTDEAPKVLRQIYKVDAKGVDTHSWVDRASRVFTWTTQFEDPSQTLVWKNRETDDPERIEFPRFGTEGLSFTKEGSIFKSEEFPGYFLKRTQTSPLGAHCPNFLILQNKNGDEKLLLASYKLAPSQVSSLSSRLRFERNAKVLGKKVSFYVYDKAKGSKEFSSSDTEANFYLSMIYGAKKEYQKAFPLLRQFGKGSSAFREGEKGVLNWISKLHEGTNDNSPQMTALRTLAAITLKRNEIEHPQARENKDPKDESEQKELATRYFQNAGKLGLFRLQYEEEFFLLENVLKKLTIDLESIRIMRARDPEKAKAAILAVANNHPLDPQEIQKILRQQSISLGKTEPTPELHIEPIVQDPLAFLEPLPLQSQAAEMDADLQDLFSTQGKAPEEQRGLEFYHHDSRAYLKQKPQVEYRLKDLKGLQDKRKEIEGVYHYMTEVLAQAELAISRLASTLPVDPIEQARILARSAGNTVARVDLNELIGLYMTHDLKKLKLQNPELSDAKIVELDSLLDLYLDLAVQNGQRKRVAQKIREVEDREKTGEDGPALQLALQSFVSEAGVKREFNPSKNRFLKVFEYHNGFYYRAKQIAMLQNLGVKLDGGSITRLFESIIFEMIVGAGKTTYLLPTVGFWNANGKRLSMAIMPEALIGHMARQVEQILGKTFGQKVRYFEFSRDTKLSAESMQALHKMLEEVIEKKEYLIATDKSVKAFLNQYTKTLYEAEIKGNGELKKIAEGMRQILKIFNEKTDLLCDEADLILDPRRELNFPYGEAVKIFADFRNLSLQLYKFLMSSEIQELASFDFSPSSAEACTPNFYDQKVKPILAKKFIELLGSEECDTTFPALRQFYKATSQEEKKLLYRVEKENGEEVVKGYFVGIDPEHKGEDWIRTLPSDIRKELGLIRGQLNVIFPLTSQKNYGERYSFHTETSILADPNSGSNNPNFGSQFSDPFERINYTIQAYLKLPGIRRVIIEKLVHDLQKRASKEMQENRETIKKLPPLAQYKTAAHGEFEEYFGKREDLHLFHPDLVNKLLEIIKTEPKIKFDLIEKYVLPHVTLYPKNSKATSQSIAYIFNNVKSAAKQKPGNRPEKGINGFTGTLWNSGTYHDALRTKVDEGARGQVVVLAYKQARGKVSTLKINNPVELHRELIIDNENYQHVKALIDAGGALKELNLETVAKEWLDTLIKKEAPIDGVVFFAKRGSDTKEQPYIWAKGESAPIPLSKNFPPNRRITIYDQKHTTGTDILQAIDAVALVTVSKGMIMRDFIQAVGRMRQLASGQSIMIAVLEQDALVIREKLGLAPDANLSIKDVIRFLILSEVKRQCEDNQVATNHKLLAIIQEWFLEKVLNAKNTDEILAQLTHSEFIERLFFQTSEIDPFSQYGHGSEKIDAKTAYYRKLDALIEKLELESLFLNDSFLNPNGNSLDEIRTLLKNAIDTAIEKGHLPAEVDGSLYSGDMEEEQEIEMEQEQEQEQEQEMQQEELQDKTSHQKPWRHSPWNDLDAQSVEKSSIYNINRPSWSPSRYTYAHFLKVNDVAPPNSKIFDDELQLSHNFQLNGPVYTGNGVIPFGEFQKPIQNILVTENLKDKTFKLSVIEPFDAASFKEALQKKQGAKEIQKDPDVHSLGGHSTHPDYFSQNNRWYCLNIPVRGSCGEDNPRFRDGPGEDVSVWIGDLDGYSIYESKNPIPKEKLESDPKLERLFVQAAYFNGEINYSGKKRDTLKAWLAQAAEKLVWSQKWRSFTNWHSYKASPKEFKEVLEKIEKDFTDTIISFKEQSQRDYQKSSLAQVFRELIVETEYKSGEIHYSNKKRDTLKAYLSQMAGPKDEKGANTKERIEKLKTMEKEFQDKNVIQWEMKKEYPESPLAKIFKELREEP